MVATAGSIAKLPSKNVAMMAQDPQMSNMMLRALLRNHSEKTPIVPRIRSSPSIANQAKDLSVFASLLTAGLSSNHGKHRAVAVTSHNTEEMTPPFPLEVFPETEKARLELMLLVGDGPAIFYMSDSQRKPHKRKQLYGTTQTHAGCFKSTGSRWLISVTIIDSAGRSCVCT